ncbi:MAG: hypothetical protein D6684_06575 [Deinococcus-Thermus bacterium]|nr:MAG: hypothetical protein D6684_06575 [Deinococcota bacterium]
MDWKSPDLTLRRHLVFSLLQGTPGLRPFLDPDGDSVLILQSPQGEAMALVVVGWQKEVLVVQARVEGLEGVSTLQTNAWNAQRRWPRAWVQEGRVHLDFQVLLWGDLGRGLLASILLPVIAAIGEFLEWIEQEGGKEPVLAA